MTERTFYQTIIRPKLSSFGMVRRIENVLENGMPDVVVCLQRAKGGPGISSFIELKWAPRWPTRTPLRFAHYTPDQDAWLASWASVGGRCCVIAQVGQDFFLIEGKRCGVLRQPMTRSQFIANAAVHGETAFPTGKMVLWLTKQ